MKTTVFGIAALATLLLQAEGARALPARISRAEWLWSANVNPKSSTGTWARCTFEVKGAVKKARFWTIIENSPHRVYVNGINQDLRQFPEFRDFRSHERGYGADITKILREGKNVIAVTAERSTKRTLLGFILRGEIEYADGRVQRLYSAHEDFKAADAPEPNWQALDFDDSKWPQATARGDVRLTPWSRYGNIPAIYCTEEEHAAYLAASSVGYPEARILAEPESPHAKIAMNGNVTGIEINGEVVAPFVRNVGLASSPAFDAGEIDFAKTGIRLLRFGVNDAYRTINGGFDFSELDAQIRHLLSIYPDCYIYIGYWTHIGEMFDWLDRHPDELVRYADGGAKFGTDVGYYGACPKAPSIASPVYRAEVLRLVEAFAAFAKSKSWGRRILAMRFGLGPSNDGMPWGCYRMPDVGLRMTAAFRRYLLETYPDDAALRKAWRDPAVTRATATCPDRLERIGTGGNLRDRADGRDAKTLDYYRAYHREFSGFIREFGRTVHRVLPGRLAGAYHGYTLLGYTPEGTSACSEEMLASGDIDFLFSTNPDYSLLNNQHYAVHSVYHRYGKLASMEGDIRTHNNPYAEEHWKCKTPEETISSVTKEVTTSILNGCGFHFSMFSGSNERNVFSTPEVMDPLKRGIAVWHDAFRRPPKGTGDIAVVVDPNMYWRQGSPEISKQRPFVNATGIDMLMTLDFTGYACETFATEDFLASDRDFRAVVLLSAWEPSAEIAKGLGARLAKPGTTAVWCYAPGLLGKNGFSDAGMKALTGFDLRARREACAPDVKFADGTAYCSPRLAADALRLQPRVSCAEGDGETLATWSDDGTRAAVRRTNADGSVSVFVGFPLHRVDRWAEILAKAGCHAYAPKGFHVRATDRFVQVVSCRNGRLPPGGMVLAKQIGTSADIPVTLPRKAAEIVDAFTGETVATGTDAFTLHAENPHTWFLEVK